MQEDYAKFTQDVYAKFMQEDYAKFMQDVYAKIMQDDYAKIMQADTLPVVEPLLQQMNFLAPPHLPSVPLLLLVPPTPQCPLVCFHVCRSSSFRTRQLPWTHSEHAATAQACAA